MKSLQEFKNEFKLVCTDTWGNALDAWFECCGQMNKRHIETPEEWEYKPGLGGGCDKDSYWYSIFQRTNKKTLVQIGQFLFRYCQYLKYKQVDY